MTVFTLTVVTSCDGFIARAHDDAPQTWASAEEQDLFFQDVNAADWAIMGRHTHEAADRPDRRRIVFSSNFPTPIWRRPTQVWINPTQIAPKDLPGLVRDLHPLAKGLILGGTRVHDWFLDHDAIDRVHLTIEPVTFGGGLPLFSRHQGTPEQALTAAGFAEQEVRVLNAQGTRHAVWTRA